MIEIHQATTDRGNQPVANGIFHVNGASLKELIELRKFKPNTKEAIAILSKLDGSIFIQDNFEDSKPFTAIANTLFGDARNQN